MDAVESRAIRGEGTTEAEWRNWPGLAGLPTVAPHDLVPAGSRAVVVAPHPDDEVLAVGGLLAQLADSGTPVEVIAVTDGTASHQGSTEWPPERLAQARPRESLRALHRLGLAGIEPTRLGMPDGGLKAQRAVLAARLVSLLRPRDVVFTTWRHDGHPDHEATGEACAMAAASAGARLVEVPVWGWHWSHPGDARMPWQHAFRLSLSEEAVRRKRAAVQAFTSQLRSDASTGSGPVLRETTVQRAARPYEVVFL
ncbi:acetylglucosaminylphosphatidylinositol deacetylase [Variovorax paradoxus]|uniref:Acetylglucosaminylphosphatidylinositol deacetylase n=1 Tax=Variovorax paradoxus TaxID=34073 RepID=A0AA91DJC2_VARPD|nr:PIG-L family deacetylase [Variovorax paradoxus]OAK58872.1 acetylglucosaminylphosphatidylinositol deacetylase [Variovorax paradoxus]